MTPLTKSANLQRLLE